MRAGVPVLCIGNFVAGGAGKTPTAIAFGRALAKAGYKPGFLSRGFGGRLPGPVRVDLAVHRVDEVGDEALLLAAQAPTVVSANRGAGAARLVAEGRDFIVMDDGFQNPGLAKDFCAVVVDAGRGVGNGFTIPAGPLRAPLSRQFALADAIIVIGDGPAGDRLIREAARRGKPVYLARIVPASKPKWGDRRFLAFAGIGNPGKFFASLAEAGADVAATRVFGDHHGYSEEEVGEIVAQAQAEGLTPITTRKDHVRLAGAGEHAAELAAMCEVFDIQLEFDDPRTLSLIIDATAANAAAGNVARG
jgi:tetraacyldisaccharide 4'-kinase